MAAENIHAGLVAVGGRGVLITGPARSGKSALAISLLRGASREGLSGALVADDRVLVAVRNGALYGTAPETITGLIEISGAGILRLPAVSAARIDLLVVLEDDPPRLPEAPHALVAGVELPRVFLPSRQAPFAADVVLTLLMAGEKELIEL